MTKSELVKQISYSTGIDYATALTVVESFMSEVKSSLANQEPVFLRGFGSFILKHRAEKTARNISRNTTVIVPEHDIPAFKPAKEFVASISKLKIFNMDGLHNYPFICITTICRGCMIRIKLHN